MVSDQMQKWRSRFYTAHEKYRFQYRDNIDQSV